MVASWETADFKGKHGTMEDHLQQTIAILTRTPRVLDALLRDLPEPCIFQNEGGQSWNAFEIVGHLVHGERTDWMSRARIILEEGETRIFPPFDRKGHEHESEGLSLAESLDEFARLRSENLVELRGLNLHAEDLERRGQHPAFGAVTLSELLATWATHDLTHLHQLSRVLAYPYREAVGPWSRYLGVLQCSGHSSAS